METPQSVTRGTIAIWASLFISAAASVVAARMGLLGAGELAFALLVYALLCIIPYKIGNGSNATRYVYFVLCVLGVLISLAGVDQLTQPERIASLVEFPLTIYSIVQLLQPSSNAYFARRPATR
jgi:hypothetical protein